MTRRRPRSSAQAVDAVLGPPDSSWVGAERSEVDGHSSRGGHAARGQRHLLLPTLHAVQARVGWISPGALGYICRRLTIPPAEAYGVASFYALFALEPRPPVVAHVCTDIACMCRGSNELVAELERTVGPSGEHPGNGRAIWLESPCLGLCERAPAVLVTQAGEDPAERSIAPASAAQIADALAGRLPGEDGAGSDRPARRCLATAAAPVRDGRSRRAWTATAPTAATRPCGRRSRSGRPGVIREVSESKLLGRGGAAFPTGRKWEAVARQPIRPHYLVCNADESEPGTFKDRIVVEQDPFSRDRGDDDRGLRDRLRARLPVPARRVSAGMGAARGRGHARRARTASWARTSWARGCASTSSCARARAHTSAARRRRSSTPSRASAASRATSRRSRSTPACSRSRRW